MRIRPFVAFVAWAFVVLAVPVFTGCGEPELSEEAKQAEGSDDPTAETGSPAPGIPPQPPLGVPGAPGA